MMPLRAANTDGCWAVPPITSKMKIRVAGSMREVMGSCGATGQGGQGYRQGSTRTSLVLSEWQGHAWHDPISCIVCESSAARNSPPENLTK
jgi:hypothetical protein